MAPVLVTLKVISQGHSPFAGLFKCNPSHMCAVFYQISTDSTLARSLSDSWASCITFTMKRLHVCMFCLVKRVYISGFVSCTHHSDRVICFVFFFFFTLCMYFNWCDLENKLKLKLKSTRNRSVARLVAQQIALRALLRNTSLPHLTPSTKSATNRVHGVAGILRPNSHRLDRLRN